METSRRSFGRILLAGALPAGLARPRSSSEFEGVRLGVCTYSFRDLPRRNGDAIGPVLDGLKVCHVGVCELFSPQIEPEDPGLNRVLQSINKPGPDGQKPSMEAIGEEHRAYMKSPEAKQNRQRLREWRLTTPTSYFENVRKKFDDAGVDIYAYTLNFGPDSTHEELDKCFQQTQAMQVKIVASSTKVSMLPRLKSLAEKYKIYVAVHGHSDTKHPDEFSSPETFQKALDASPWFRVNVDIGHFSAAGFDPVAYIEAHHDRITHLHIKDRKKDNGPNEPLGQGDTPIKPVLQLLKEKKYPIPALVEYEYAGSGSPVEEVQKCLAYMKSALQSS